MRRFRVALLLEALAVVAGALALAHGLTPDRVTVDDGFGIIGVAQPDSDFEYMGPFDSRLWLGLAIGFAVSGVVAALGRRSE